MNRSYDPAENPIHINRRAERSRDDDWVRQFLQTIQIGHVATRWDDQPFVTPLNFWYDPDRHAIYFHGSHIGRLRANIARHPRVCFEASRAGKLLASNTAGEFSTQFEGVMVFGTARLVEQDEEKRGALYGLLGKYFPAMQPGEHYRPITQNELDRTSVYAIQIESWSGKRNWPERAKQSSDWPPLGPEWFEEPA
jgi:nitroimidazol reductase NimA-like FMN-containing flavoprotein (pyridoxamine 5'-phosphate oxidase superfamily)